MATIYFSTAPTATNFSTATNFNTAPDGSGSTGLPSAGDTLIFPGGNQTITAGFTGLSAIALAAVYVMPGCAISVASGQSLTLDVSSGSAVFQYAGVGGEFNVTAGTGGIDSLQVNSSVGRFNLVGGTTAIAGAFGGQLFVGGSAVVTTLYGANSFIDIQANGTAITLMDIQASTVNVRRTVTTAQLTGNSTLITLDAAAITTANVNGATLNYRSYGTLGTCNLRAGVLTPAGALGNPTITTLNVYGSNATTQYISRSGANSFTATPVFFGTASSQVDQQNS